jgi:beta-lactamase class A
MRITRVFSAAAFLLGVALSAAQAAGQSGPLQQALAKQLEARLDAVATRLDGVLGYAVVDLTAKQRVASRLPDEAFPTASTIKLSILYELLKQAEEQKLTLDKPALLEKSQVAGGSGVLQHLSAPMLSLIDHAALMIILSDNTSTNVVIDAVGMSSVMTRMKALGLADIQLRRKMMDAAGLKRGDEIVASRASLAGIAVLVWRGDGIGADSRDAARRILHQVGGQIRAAVPGRIRVASKTGGLEGVRAEAAVIELESRPYALAVMTTYLRSEADGERAIRDVADAAFSYFDRLAAGGAYGRKAP